ncbi:uncharacterized protein LOC143344962 [Colletes latitarsis]|uniref:uncharacterized protein LOC143344962 n=1 Tax=Colletes latitarsis TaxID=2605962 RepID=UPI0040359CF5
MEGRLLQDFATARLKELLRERAVSTSGAKNELTARLLDHGGEPVGVIDGGEASAQDDIIQVPCITTRATEMELMRLRLELLEKEKQMAIREAELARRELEDDTARILIVSKLRGKALDWFHSRPEYMELSIEILLRKMESMFHQRMNRLAARRQFEARAWHRGETFADYLHQKVILANRISIDQEELIDCVIDGIPDPVLQDQVRLQRFKTNADLLVACGRITLRARAVHATPKGEGSTTGYRTEGPSNNATGRCTNCGDRGHPTAECPARNKGRKCFHCNEYGHVSRDCPTKKISARDVLAVAVSAESKYRKDIRVNGCAAVAVLDTESDVSLIRENVYRDIRAPPLMVEKMLLYRIGSEEYRTLGKFDAEILIDGEIREATLHVVKDVVLNYGVLRGFDFIDAAEWTVRDGKMTLTKQANAQESTPEIMYISHEHDHDRDAINLSHIENVKLREDVETAVREYEPDRSRDVGVTMKIILKDDDPVYQRPRRLSPSEREEVNRQINEWVHDGIAQPSFSEYASPIVLVKKRDGTARLFVNTAFKDLIEEKIVLTYIDDLVVNATDFEVGIQRLKRVLKRATECGLVIKWSKCEFLKTRVEYLGHVVEDGTVRPTEDKTKAIARFPTLTTIKQIQSCLGLSGYFRKFVAEYSAIARPLTRLLKANVPFKFGPEEQTAFQLFKEALLKRPVLRIYRPERETELHTDASMYGYGAIFLQRDSEDDALHPVYYASGMTSTAEQRYPSYELEVLAIIRALRKFRVYLLGIPFKLVTDCRAFALTMWKKDFCVRVARWALLLEEFQYTIEHRPGNSMRHVDALSRNPVSTCLAIESEDRITARIRRSQECDSDLQKIIDSVSKRGVDGYALKRGLLLREVNEDWRIVIPKGMQTQVARKAHKHGHFSTTKTEALLQRDYWFPAIRTKVEKVVQVMDRLRKQAVIFGNPRRIISDHGTAYTFQAFEKYSKDQGIEHVLITTGVPREQQFLNATPHRSTGMPPFTLLVGTRIHLKDDPEVRHLIETELRDMFQADRNEIGQQARESLQRIQQENRGQYNKRWRNARVYQEGDLVSVQRTQFGPGLKLAGKFLGPYEITRVLRNDRYVVAKVGEHEGPLRTSASADHIKPWIEGSNESEEENEEEVEERN